MSESNTSSTEVAIAEVANLETSPVEAQQETAKPEEVVSKEAEVSETEVKEEQKPEPKEEPKKEKDLFAPKFAALSRKEKAIRQKEAEIEAKAKELADKEAKLLKLDQLKKENPAKALEELGLTYEEITQAILNDGKPTPEQEQKRMIESLKEEISALKREREEERKKQEEEKVKVAEENAAKTIENFKKDIKDYVVANSDKYELIQTYDAFETVYDTVKEYYEQTGNVLDISEAADLVEQFYENEAKKILKAKKFSQFVSPPKVEEKKSTKAPSESPKTLENELASQVPNQREGKLSKEESLARAASLIRWSE